MIKELIRRLCVVLWLASLFIVAVFSIEGGVEHFIGSLSICGAFSACVQYLTLGTIDPRKVFKV